MRSANASEHGLGRAHGGALADAVGPWAGTVQNPSCVDALIFPRDAIAQQYATGATLGDIDRQHFAVIADNSASFNGLGHPLGDEAFGEFALRILKVEHQPLLAGVKCSLHAYHLHFGQRRCLLSGNALIEPETGANFHRAALAMLVQQEQEVNGMDQMGTLAQQALTLAERFANQIEFAVLEIA